MFNVSRILDSYWNSETIDIRINPKRAVHADGLHEFLKFDCGMREAVVVTTSGSTGTAKFVVLTRRALLASAQAVNLHCQLTRHDHWLCGLPTFHVGGLGIYARAALSGAKVTPFDWTTWHHSGASWLEALEKSRATVSSITPPHLFDIVANKLCSPKTLRGLFLGGGHIDRSLVHAALDLGWPVWPTYGMSEAASQIATATTPLVDWLPVLPHWQCQTGPDGRLQIRGDALFSGYIEDSPSGWIFVEPRDSQGWFTTGDRCKVANRELQFVGRVDDAIKISGELVCLSQLNQRATRLGVPGYVVAQPHPRRENEIVLVLGNPSNSSQWLELFNRGLPSIEQASHILIRPDGNSSMPLPLSL